jgi:hypothetical protein
MALSTTSNPVTLLNHLAPYSVLYHSATRETRGINHSFCIYDWEIASRKNFGHIWGIGIEKSKAMLRVDQLR